MNVYITGVSGFIGSHLARHLLAAGHQVSGSGRTVSSRARAPSRLARFDAAPLDGRISPAGFAGIDAVVHTAYDPAPTAEERNVQGTLRWRDAALAARVPQQIFVSSSSADAEATSAYGRQKARLEAAFAGRGLRVVRPGLVVGDGGLFGRLIATLRRWPVVPLLDGGRHRTPITAVADLVEALGRLLAGVEAPAAVNLFNRQPVIFGDLLRQTRRALGRRTLLVPVPSALLIGPLTVADRLGIRLPINIDNLRGYRAMSQRVLTSDYAGLVPAETSCEAMVGQAVASWRARTIKEAA